MAINPIALFPMEQINQKYAQNSNKFNNAREDETSEKKDVDQIETPRTSAVSWWNTSFRYRRVIEISNPYSNLLTNYPAKITFDYNGLVTAGKMRSDLKDVRIVENGVLRNYFYKKDFPTSGQATVWFETNNGLFTERDTYLYYGNSTSNIESSYFIDERFGVAWYRFEQDFTDSSGNGNNPTLFSVPPPTFSSPKIESNSSYFSGNAYEQVPDSPSLSPRYEISIAFWVNLTAASQTAIRKNFRDYMFEFGTPGSLNPGTNPLFYVRTSPFGGLAGSYCIHAAAGLQLNRWYHCVGTYNYQTGSKMYINGSEVAVIVEYNLKGQIYDENSYLNLGYWGPMGEVFYGRMDDVKIFNRSLSTEDISWEYNLGFPLSISLQTQEEVGETFLDWTYAGKYKNIPLYTPKMRFNPSKSDYLVVISPLLAQAGKIESYKMDKAEEGAIKRYLHTYRNQTEDAIIATLEAHPNAYVYVMDEDMKHTDNENKLKYDIYACNFHEDNSNYPFVPPTITTFGIKNDFWPQLLTNNIWEKYQDKIQLKLKDVRTLLSSEINVLILGNSIEFPEFPIPSYIHLIGLKKFIFSDISYLINQREVLGGIGRIPIIKCQNYFQKIKDMEFQKIAYLAGSGLGVGLWYWQKNHLETINDYLDGDFYSTEYVHDESPEGYLNADLIYLAYHGNLAGPTFDNHHVFSPRNFNPSLLIGDTCYMSNNIYYSSSYKYIKNAYGDEVLDYGVTLFGNTIEGLYVPGCDDSRTIGISIIKEIISGRSSTIGQVQQEITSKNLDFWAALQMRILGDPALDISNFDAPSKETIQSLPKTFSTNYSLSYSLNQTDNGDVLFIDVESSKTSIWSMENNTSQKIVNGGELMVPSLEYYINVPTNQTIESCNLILSDNQSISVSDPAEASSYLMTPNGAVAIPNLNVNNETSYPRLTIQCSELSWKKIYKIQVFPALYNDSSSKFVLSKNITLLFEVANTSLTSNASLSYNPIEFNPYVKAHENNTLSFELVNSIKSVENATAVKATLTFPSDLIIHDSNGTIQGHTIKWELDQLELSEYLYVNYETPTSIVTNKEDNVTLFVEYFSEGGTKYNKFNVTISLYYLKDGFCNLKLANVSLYTNLIQGQELNIYYDVKNTGEIKISHVPVQIFLGDTLINSTTVSLLNPNEKISLDFSKIANTPGTYVLSIKIPSMSVESNLTDNEFAIQITVIGLGLPSEQQEDEEKKEEEKVIDNTVLVLALILTCACVGVASIVIVAKRELLKNALQKLRRNNKSKK